MQDCCLCALEPCSEAGFALAPVERGVGAAAGAQAALGMHCMLVPKPTLAATVATDVRNIFNTVHASYSCASHG